MADQVTSTDRRLLYKAVFSPGGEEYLVEAGTAVSAHGKATELAARDELRYTGIDVFPASENDITDYYGTGEEE